MHYPNMHFMISGESPISSKGTITYIAIKTTNEWLSITVIPDIN